MLESSVEILGEAILGELGLGHVCSLALVSLGLRLHSDQRPALLEVERRE